jgi:hypothetical protein
MTIRYLSEAQQRGFFLTQDATNKYRAIFLDDCGCYVFAEGRTIASAYNKALKFLSVSN